MEKKIGAVLARTFREVCEESNKRVRSDYSTISSEEIQEIEQLLEQIDKPAFGLPEALERYLNKNVVDEKEGK
jgi:hypothetical protein